MKQQDYLALLQQALASENGLALQVCHDPALPPSLYMVAARRVRRRLYVARDRAREAGDRAFDKLSVLIRPEGEVWIVRRDKLPGMVDDDGDDGYQAETSSLSPGQLPLRVLARGPAKLRIVSFR